MVFRARAVLGCGNRRWCWLYRDKCVCVCVFVCVCVGGRGAGAAEGSEGMCVGVLGQVQH